jgi:hypothetical protein
VIASSDIDQRHPASRTWLAPVIKSGDSSQPRILLRLGASEPGGAELGGGCFDVALPVLAGERRAATLTPVGGAPGEPG